MTTRGNYQHQPGRAAARIEATFTVAYKHRIDVEPVTATPFPHVVVSVGGDRATGRVSGGMAMALSLADARQLADQLAYAIDLVADIEDPQQVAVTA